jgi:hypothetical protein
MDDLCNFLGKNQCQKIWLVFGFYQLMSKDRQLRDQNELQCGENSPILPLTSTGRA